MSNIVVKGVDENLKRQFKSICALEGKSMAEKIKELMEKEVAKK
jgi:hypothetical protein